MLARIAQELFWLGRDLARAEHTARMLDGVEGADLEALASQPLAARLLGRAEVASLLTLDTDSQASIVSCVARARERGRGLRDVMSTEMWEALNTFHIGLAGRDLSAALVSGPYSVYHDVKVRAVLGTCGADHAPRRGPFVPRGRRSDRGRGHGAEDAAGLGPARAQAVGQ